MNIRSTEVIIKTKFVIHYETEDQFWARLQELKRQVVRTEYQHADARDAVTDYIPKLPSD